MKFLAFRAMSHCVPLFTAEIEFRVCFLLSLNLQPLWYVSFWSLNHPPLRKGFVFYFLAAILAKMFTKEFCISCRGSSISVVRFSKLWDSYGTFPFKLEASCLTILSSNFFCIIFSSFSRVTVLIPSCNVSFTKSLTFKIVRKHSK